MTAEVNLRREFALNKWEAVFLLAIYALGLYLRLAPRLAVDPHLLTFQGDIWYRLTMAQYIQDYGILPEPDIRYRAYLPVPMWYPPLSLIFFAATSSLTGLDIPTVSSRLVPFLEALTPLSMYFLGRYLYNHRVGAISTLALALTPSFVFWSGISDPQSFTFFLIPILVMLWVMHSREKSNRILLAVGLAMGVDFLLHLSYFVVVLVLLMVTLGLIAKGEADRALLVDLGKVVVISQVIAAPWWLPRNLYWWWIKALVTSSGLYSVTHQLQDYGILAAILGMLSYAYLLLGGRRHLLIILWALLLFIETQNEAILKAFGAIHLSWSTLAKPLEGFRFYPFLAQPLSLAMGVLLSNRRTTPILAIALLVGLMWNLGEYGLSGKFQNSGITAGEYEAAVWFRHNSQPSDRLVADYYRAQMIAGVSGGKVLLGGVFPLRNVEHPYIRAPGRVQNDLFILYNTSNPVIAWNIARRYNATHIFYSDNMRSYGNLLSYYQSASDYGVDVVLEKFGDARYFELVYVRDTPYGVVKIFGVK
ncbi:MAG: hypothetical protein ACE5G7_04065 [Candidatus Hydrothermarchaeaceae archaeon]